MQDRPTAAELLDAVREFLEADAAPDSHHRYHARVAANVLAILKRELESEPEATRAEWRRLSQLLGRRDDMPDVTELHTAVTELRHDLARSIRSGRLDGRFDEVFAVLGESVAAKLRVANPRYAQR